MSTVKFKYTETFNNTVGGSITHLSQWTDERVVIDRIGLLIEEFEEKIGDNPLIYARCSELVQFGNTSIREMKKDGLRVLDEVSEIGKETVVTVLVFLGQRQSIQDNLVTYCLTYK
jgi:hypothetical protein